jgi:hypothetical protein
MDTILWIIVFLAACAVITLIRIAITRTAALRDRDANLKRMQEQGGFN